MKRIIRAQSFPSADFWSNLKTSDRIDAYFSYIDGPEREALNKLNICANLFNKEGDKVIVADALSANRFYPVIVDENKLWQDEENLAKQSSSSAELVELLVDYFKKLTRI